METIKEFKIEDGATFTIGEVYLLKKDVVKVIKEIHHWNKTAEECKQELKERIEG